MQKQQKKEFAKSKEAEFKQRNLHVNVGEINYWIYKKIFAL